MYSNVKAELARQNKTVVDLAESTGIRYQTLTHKLRGTSEFTLAEAIKVKGALGVDIPLETLFSRKV